jgi:hypothetical protein
MARLFLLFGVPLRLHLFSGHARRRLRVYIADAFRSANAFSVWDFGFFGDDIPA